MRVRDEVPGSWEGARGRGENWGGIRVTGVRELVTGWEGREKGEVREGASGLPDVGSAGTGGDGVICPPAVCTETPISLASAFLGGESTPGTPGTVQIHGGGIGGARDRGTRGGVAKGRSLGMKGGRG